MFCEFASDEAYVNSFASEIYNNMRHNGICSHCVGHKSVGLTTNYTKPHKQKTVLSFVLFVPFVVKKAFS